MKMMIHDLLNRYKPGILRKYLLLVAGFVWLCAGIMLLGRGSAFVLVHGSHACVEIIAAAIIGALFYMLLFVKISLHHINRIRAKKARNHASFRFLTLRDMC